MIPGSGRSAGEGILPTPVFMGLPVGSAGKESPCSVGDLVDPWVGKMPWRRKQLLTPVFWLGEFHGQYSPWGQKESDTTEQLLLFFSPFHLEHFISLVDPNCRHHYSCALGLLK